MGYGNKIFQAACQELERRKRQAEELADRAQAFTPVSGEIPRRH